MPSIPLIACPSREQTLLATVPLAKSRPCVVMMIMKFIHVSMYLADANWGHNIKIK